MKRMVIHFGLLVLLVLLTIPLPEARAKDMDLSVTGSVAYDQGKWESGEFTNPSGAIHKTWVGITPSIQIKYNRWKFQPTFEFNFRREYFNFSNWEQFAHMRPTVYSFLVGITHDFKPFSGYLLVGYSIYEIKGVFAETLAYPITNHGKVEITQNVLAFKIGAYKMWDIEVPLLNKIKVGPEVGLMIYPRAAKVERCREISLNKFVPTVGLRIQW